MKKNYLILFLMVTLATIVLPRCGGGGSKNPDPPAETNLAITASPVVNGQSESPAPGPNFPLSVTVTSTMPPQGVKIEVTATPEGSSTAFYTDTKTTSSTTSNFVITNTPQTVVCRVTVTVTSVSKATNKVTGFYLYSRK
jgi:hypothetical protein